jgi:predicted DNA-binding ribbon-helix-helix protein
MTTSQFAVKLYDELIALRGEPPTNFASFLRVCCLRYLSMRADKGADKGADSGVGVADAMPALVLTPGDARPRILKTV